MYTLTNVRQTYQQCSTSWSMNPNKHQLHEQHSE